MSEVFDDFARRNLYLCTGLRDDMAAFLPSVLRGGVDIVQLREKIIPPHEQVDAAREMQAICHDFGVPFIINDSPELAFDLGADGVHVGQDDVSVARCRQLLGPHAVVGLSTHSDPEFDLAMTMAATYLSAGPIEATPTKPGRAGTGEAFALGAAGRSPQPVFVTGGITPQRIEELRPRGLSHFVVVRYLTEAADPFAAASALRAALHDD